MPLFHALYSPVHMNRISTVPVSFLFFIPLQYNTSNVKKRIVVLTGHFSIASTERFLDRITRKPAFIISESFLSAG